MAGTLERAYLMVGADELKRDTAVRRLKARLDESLAAFNLDELHASSEIDAASLMASLNTLPVGDAFRLVLIHDAERLPKAVSAALVKYLSNPNPTSVLALVAEKLSRATRLYKAIAAVGKRTIVDCSPKKRSELPWQVSKMATVHGVTMANDAAKELVSRVGERTTLLDAQVATLADLCRERGTITLDDVRQHVARVAEVRPWDLLDAVSERDGASALELYGLMRNPSQIALLSMLVGRIRELICAQSMQRRGQSWGLADELGKQPWQVKNHARWAQAFAPGELEHLLARCAQGDAEMKSGMDADLVFTELLLSVCNRA